MRDAGEVHLDKMSGDLEKTFLDCDVMAILIRARSEFPLWNIVLWASLKKKKKCSV